MRHSPRIEVRIPTQEGLLIEQELAKPAIRGCERVVLALAGVSKTPKSTAVLVSNPHPIPENAYRMTTEGTSWDPRFTAEVASKALKRNLGVLVFHGHPLGAIPRLSETDVRSFEILLLALRATIPSALHGSLVIGPSRSVGGKVWFAGNGSRDIAGVKWLGSPIEVWPPNQSTHSVAGLYKSQVDLIGEAGQRLLQGTTLGIIGLGGGGSHVVQQASRAGFGKLILVEHDTVEEKNRSRTVGTRATDVGKSKTVPMKRLIREASKDIGIEICTDRFPSQASIDKLKTCDLVVSCVDTLSARAEVIKFAWRYLVPVIDIGIGIGTHTFDTETERRIDRLAGHVHVYLPGGPCMWCSGLLTVEKIEAETGGHPEYLEGRGGPGQVISFNGVVASLAVTEAMQLVTSMFQGGPKRLFVKYDGITPTLLYEEPTRKRECVVCGTELGAGEPRRA